MKKLSICPLGKVWVNCLKSLKKPSIYPLGKTLSAPSVYNNEECPTSLDMSVVEYPFIRYELDMLHTIDGQSPRQLEGTDSAKTYDHPPIDGVFADMLSPP